MGKLEKLYEHILMRRSDANVQFETLRALLRRLGFDERIKGDQHIFTKDGVEEILNLQPKGGKGKPFGNRKICRVNRTVLKFKPIRVNNI